MPWEPQRSYPLSGNPHQGLAPSGNARRLRRETLSVCVAPPMPAARLRLSGLVATTRLTRRQIPSEGNPHQVLAPSGFTSRLRRETRLQRWIHRKAQLLAALDSPQGAALGTVDISHHHRPRKRCCIARQYAPTGI
ncbi:hypothetical protein [Brasilonema sennae]|uniref:hypothetical protein n=1 Tax=Brasilonema sennae TaxID=1397703 RepID=UPI00155A4AF0|nr:hypothetical protein [Brasilonema sennae]